MKYLITLIILILLVLVGCSPGESEPPVGPMPAPSITVDNFPRLDGSTSTEPVLAQITCYFMQVPCEWMEWLGGDRRLVPSLTDSVGEFPSFNTSGTHEAYVNLIAAQADLILVARAPSPDELQLASISAVRLDVQPFALDAFVFIVNEGNPLEGLTSDQIRQIYSGKLTNWSEVGGRQAEIHAYQREENSGSQELMQDLVMRGRRMIAAPDLVLPTMFAPFYAITEDPDGIGYSVYFYEQNMAPLVKRTKLIAVDGIHPEAKSISAREYPYTTEVFAVTTRDLPEDSLAIQLRDWLLSPEGQALVAESGYVPID